MASSPRHNRTASDDLIRSGDDAVVSFTLDRPVEFEESLSCEFKEAKANPVQAVSKVVDEYVVAFLNEAGGSIYWGIRDADRVVTGVPISGKLRDELRQVIGQKVASIAPSVPGEMVEAPFHTVVSPTGDPEPTLCVLEVRVAKPTVPGLFLTGSGEAYRRTMGGTKKLSGAELFQALAVPLQQKVPRQAAPSVLAGLPAVQARASLVASLIQGKRVLWVDDQPANNFYERVALTQMGLVVDLALSTAEAIHSLRYLKPDLILSDMARQGKQDAGLDFLTVLRAEGLEAPVVFYVGQVDRGRPTPESAFAMTDRPDELLHLVLDVLERGAR
jgi:CheY-like chemotaxis protein